MKYLLTALCLLLGTFGLATPSARALAADGDFTKAMTVDELVKTGLEKLSPEELAQLKAVVERYKAGEVAAVKQEAEAAVAVVKHEAATKVAAAEAKATQAEQVTASDKKKPGWLRALITLERTSGNPEKDGSIESRIAGAFDGWTSNSSFRLENGQIWQVLDADGGYVTKPVPSPQVKIFPARLAGFWMEIEGVNPRVKVKPVKLD